jgi:hypothetical protein
MGFDLQPETARMFRVFATTDFDITPAAVLEFLQTRDPQVRGSFRGDDEGWFAAEVRYEGSEVPIRIERFLSSEDGIRTELNTWAAWLESKEANTHAARLMREMIGVRQIFTIEDGDAESAAELCAELCRHLARQTEGVYQVDGQGFFDASGLLLVPEDV